MTEKFEAEIRKALDAKAYEVEVPADLATRTVETASEIEVRQPLLRRAKVWRDGRRMRFPSTGYPRWLLAPAAAFAVLALLGIGLYVSQPNQLASEMSFGGADEGYDYRTERGDDGTEADQSGTSGSGDAVAGEVAGVVSAGDASVDATNRRDEFAGETGESLANTSVDTGDADGANTASQFVGLTAPEGLAPELVRSANIRVAVGDFEDAWAQANEVATDHGGAVIDSKTSQVADEIAEGTVRMRVPSNELEAVLKDLRDLGTLARLDTSGDDISKQIDDVKTDIEELRAEEKELKALEERASTVSETLQLRDRLENVRKRIEAAKKKQAAYEDKVDTSIVNATIFQDEVAAGRGSTILGNALQTAGKLFLTILAGSLVVAAALAPLALLALAIWLGVRTIRKRRAA